MISSIDKALDYTLTYIETIAVVTDVLLGTEDNIDISKYSLKESLTQEQIAMLKECIETDASTSKTRTEFENKLSNLTLYWKDKQDFPDGGIKNLLPENSRIILRIPANLVAFHFAEIKQEIVDRDEQKRKAEELDDLFAELDDFSPLAPTPLVTPPIEPITSTASSGTTSVDTPGRRKLYRDYEINDAIVLNPETEEQEPSTSTKVYTLGDCRIASFYQQGSKINNDFFKGMPLRLMTGYEFAETINAITTQNSSAAIDKQHYNVTCALVAVVENNSPSLRIVINDRDSNSTTVQFVSQEFLQEMSDRFTAEKLPEQAMSQFIANSYLQDKHKYVLPEAAKESQKKILTKFKDKFPLINGKSDLTEVLNHKNPAVYLDEHTDASSITISRAKLENDKKVVSITACSNKEGKFPDGNAIYLEILNAEGRTHGMMKIKIENGEAKISPDFFQKNAQGGFDKIDPETNKDEYADAKKWAAKTSINIDVLTRDENGIVNASKTIKLGGRDPATISEKVAKEEKAIGGVNKETRPPSPDPKDPKANNLLNSKATGKSRL